MGKEEYVLIILWQYLILSNTLWYQMVQKPWFVFFFVLRASAQPQMPIDFKLVSVGIMYWKQEI
jgi:hypothetical protein